MQATGLRNRFFITILAVLVSVIIGSVYLYSVFLRRERLALIDQQIRETAAALVESELGDLRKIDFAQAEAIISEELGESRIGKFFIIRNSHGEIIFETASASLLPIPDVPLSPQWFEITTKGQFIRGLNLQLHRIPDRMLQVGLVTDEKLVNPSYFSPSSLSFIVVILLLGLIVSFLLTSYLLRPIWLLDRFLSTVTSRERMQSILPAVPDSVTSNPSSSSRDEFERVIAGLNTLIAKVNKSVQFSKLWGYQMAHELKTPLSLLTLGLEKIQRKHAISDADLQDVRIEVSKISETISSFLGWAELENTDVQKRLFANRLSQVLEGLIDRASSESHRLLLDIWEDAIIPASPQHLEQLLQNLLQNALKHSGESNLVRIEVRGEELIIENQGAKIPAEVLSRIGEPFNRGSASSNTVRGHGLGLAWVISICRLYGWNIDFANTDTGTRVAVRFCDAQGLPPVQEINC